MNIKGWVSQSVAFIEGHIHSGSFTAKLIFKAVKVLHSLSEVVVSQLPSPNYKGKFPKKVQLYESPWGRVDEEPYDLDEKTLEEIKRDFYHKNLDGHRLVLPELEGSPHLFALESCLQDLFLFLKRYPEESLVATLFNELVRSQKWHEKHSIIVCANCSTCDVKEIKRLETLFCAILSQQLSRLQRGERLIVPFTTKNHALLCEFACGGIETLRTYDFKIINSGFGNEVNPCSSLIELVFLERTRTFYVVGVDSKAIESPDFLKALLCDLKRHSPIHCLEEINSLYEACKIYDAAVYHLVKRGGGKMKISQDPRWSHKLQRKGTCARKVMHYWLRENLPERLYQKLKLFITELSIERIHKAIVYERLLWDREKKEEDRSRLQNTERLLEAGLEVLQKRNTKLNRSIGGIR